MNMTVKRLVGMTPENERERTVLDVSESGRITFPIRPLPELGGHPGSACAWWGPGAWLCSGHSS